MRELVVISGKGGTGKTSISASFAYLAGEVVVADCDVDAADLHILLQPEGQWQPFYSGNQAHIDQEKCIRCGLCADYCRFDAVRTFNCADADSAQQCYAIDPLGCEGCGVCVRFCPVQAISFPESLCGDWSVGETRVGPMVHARLRVGAENSGKLVVLVKAEAKKVAKERQIKTIIVDGPPGIGCPVIASIGGATMVLIVAEATVAGEHDLLRALQLTQHFKLPTRVAINRWDINPEIAQRIEETAVAAGATVVGRIRYDKGVTQAQRQGKSVFEIATPAAADIRQIWEKLDR